MKTQTIIALLFITAVYATDKPVMRWIHGIGSNCILENMTFKKHFDGYDAECIESGNGWIGSFEAEINAACDKLNAEIPKLKDGFTLVGISQGGLVARGVLQRCEVGKYVKRLITIGGPHMGVAVIPQIDPQNIMNGFVPLCRYEWIQKIVGPCGYIRDTRDKDYDYMRNSVKELNNEYELNTDYIERIKGLDLFMAIGFDDDHMIQPKNTAVWGFYKDNEYNSYVDMETQKVFTDNRLGLKELNDSGKLFRCVVEGDHLQLGQKAMESLVLNFTNWQKQDYLNDMETVNELCVFKSVD